MTLAGDAPRFAPGMTGLAPPCSNRTGSLSPNTSATAFALGADEGCGGRNCRVIPSQAEMITVHPDDSPVMPIAARARRATKSLPRRREL
jgi:hypothetical protein